MPKVSMDKSYKTRDGRDVRVLALDALGACPVIALIKCEGETFESMGRWYPNGRRFESGESSTDLIEVKPERTAWLNIYEAPERTAVYSTRERADHFAYSDRIACVKVTFREGDGLDA